MASRKRKQAAAARSRAASRAGARRGAASGPGSEPLDGEVLAGEEFEGEVLDGEEFESDAPADDDALEGDAAYDGFSDTVSTRRRSARSSAGEPARRRTPAGEPARRTGSATEPARKKGTADPARKKAATEPARKTAPAEAKDSGAAATAKERRAAEAEQARSTRRRVRAVAPNPPWLVPTAVVLLILGLLYLVTYYISAGQLPLPIGDWNLVVGFGVMMLGGGFLMRWR